MNQRECSLAKFARVFLFTA